MLNKLILIISFTISLFANDMFYKADIDSKQAYNMQQNGVLLVDVRTKKEFEQMRAKDSIHIPLFFEKNNKRVYNINFINKIKSTLKNKNKDIILICRSGSRTKFAANILGQEGFTNVYNITYGFAYDWITAGLPVER